MLRRKCNSASLSRQSAEPFLQSSELGLPHPLTRSRVCLPPFGSGGGHIRLREGGWGSQFNGGTDLPSKQEVRR
jgi:hypothetical protein